MICIDTNVVIYIAQRKLGVDVLGTDSVVYSSVVRVESLGFQDIRSVEELRIRGFLAALQEVPLYDGLIERAIQLRQLRKMGLGDAIVAATALECGAELWTANVTDFAGIEGLRVRNPLE